MSTPRERAQRAVDATFRDQGVAASYTAPGAFTFTLCVVIRRTPDAEIGIGHGRPTMQADVVEIRRVEPREDDEPVEMAPARGGTVEIIDGDTLTIQDDPHFAPDDGERLVWLMTVA